MPEIGKTLEMQGTLPVQQTKETIKMSRYSIQKDGVDYSYGFDRPCSEYFLCYEDEDILNPQIVGLGMGELHSYGSSGNLMRGLEHTGLTEMIPKAHLEAICYDLPF